MADTSTTGTDVTLLIDAAAAAMKEEAAADAAAAEAAKAEEEAATGKAQADEAAKAATAEATKAKEAAEEAAAPTKAAAADGAAADRAAAAKAAAVKAAAAAGQAQVAKAAAKAADEAAANKAAAAKAAADRAAAAKAAAKAAADKAAAAKAALMPSAGRMWPTILGVGFFGVALGVLTSLTTATGITATLIGLLFTFVGASLLSWFKRDTISPEDRSAIAGYTGAVGAGLVVGLFIGFLCRYVEEMWIRPALVERADRPAKQLRDETEKRLRDETESLRTQIQKLNPNEKVPPDKWQQMVNTLNRIENLYAKAAVISDKPMDKAKSSSIEDTRRYIFTIQAGETDKNLAAANAAAMALVWDQNPANPEKGKLTQNEREFLQSFEQALRKNDPNAHLSPQVRDAVGEMVYRKPQSPIPEEYAKTLRNYLTPSNP